MLKLIEVKSLFHGSEFTSVLINTPAIKVYRDKHDYIITFIGERSNVDFSLDPDNEKTHLIIGKIEECLFERLDLTVAVYEGCLYVVTGHESTEDMLIRIMTNEED